MLKDTFTFYSIYCIAHCIDQWSQVGTNWAFPTRDPAVQKFRGLVELCQNLQESWS